MRTDDLDLNLLPYFNEMMKQRRVSKVSESLKVSQPAVSNALKRLRLTFDDELFVRTTHGMEPTTLARQLAEPVAYAIDTIKAAANQQVAFDPRTAERNFTLGLSDLGETYFLPTLLAHVADQAPGVQITAARNNPLTLKDDLESGRIEVSVGLSPQLQGGFFRQRLFRHRYICVFRVGHPLQGKPLSLEDYCAAEHIVVSTGSDHSELNRLLERRGIERKVRASVPHFSAVGHILGNTDLVATLPSRMFETISEPFKLSYSENPVELPDISVGLFWHGSLHRDPANQWFRRMIFELFSDNPNARP